MLCPACSTELMVNQDHAWFSVYCGNLACQSPACESGGGAKTEEAAYRMLMDEYRKEEIRKTQLFSLVYGILGVKEAKVGTALLEQRRDDLCIFACSLVNALFDKYLKGQKEHGGDIKDRDLTVELRLELLDALIYHEAQSWQTLTKKG